MTAMSEMRYGSGDCGTCEWMADSTSQGVGCSLTISYFRHVGLCTRQGPRHVMRVIQDVPDVIMLHCMSYIDAKCDSGGKMSHNCQSYSFADAKGYFCNGRPKACTALLLCYTQHTLKPETKSEAACNEIQVGSFISFLQDQIYGQMIWPDLDLPNGFRVSPGSCDAPEMRRRSWRL